VHCADGGAITRARRPQMHNTTVNQYDVRLPMLRIAGQLGGDRDRCGRGAVVSHAGLVEVETATLTRSLSGAGEPTTRSVEALRRPGRMKEAPNVVIA
jgi:hypothetical protein